MKVLLLNTPDTHVAKTTSSWDLEATDLGIFPPIGLMYIAGAIRAKGKHEVKIIDAILDRLSAKDIMEEAIKYDPDLIGMTVFTPTFYDTIQVTQLLREAMPEKLIVWGGPHTTEFPDESLGHEELVDYLVLGEAEETFPQLLDALEEGTSIKDIAGIMYKENGTIHKPKEIGYVKNIDAITIPAFDLLNFRRYYSAIGTGKTVGTICSSRGCPFKCTYCLVPFKKYRSRSVENIIEEMKLYYDKGIREFFFFDDLFNVNLRRLKAVSQGILDTGWKIDWSFRGRANAIDDESIELAKKSGLRQIGFGVEAATDEGLAEIKKNLTVEKIFNAVNICKKHGISTTTNWLIGLPHHKTREDVLHLIKTAIKLDSDYAQFNICIAYHGTEIFNQGVEEGLFDKNVWSDYVNNPIPHFAEPIWSKSLSREELSELSKMAYRKFYFRPKPILTKLKHIRHWKEFYLHVKGALTLLGFGGYHRPPKDELPGRQ